MQLKQVTIRGTFLLFTALAGLLLVGVFILAGDRTNTAAAQSPAEPTPQPTPPRLFDTLWVVRAYFDDPQMVADLAAWLEPWEVHYDKGYLVVDVSLAETTRLESMGFRLEVDEALTQAYTQPLQRAPGQTSGIPGYACYRTVEETFSAAQTLATDYPDLVEWIDIGNSWEKTRSAGAGYDLRVLKLTNRATAGEKPVLFVMSGLHAREYAPPELVTRFAEYLATHYADDPDAAWLLDRHEIHLLLHANPDGRKQAEQGIPWRKNTNNAFCTNTNNRGVDLNRNFSFQWGCCNGSSTYTCDITYRGPSAASEPETQAIEAYVRSIFPDQRGDGLSTPAPATASGIFLDIHSYGELVLWPWGFTSTPPPNAPALQTLGRKLAFFNAYTPKQAIYLYPTDGTTDDFAYGELGVAGYTLELGTDFFQGCSSFENRIMPDNLQALLYAAKTAEAPYLRPYGPEVLDLVINGAAVPGSLVAVQVRLDDTRYNNTNGTELTQAIAAGEVYLNHFPGDPEAVPLALIPADGSFDEGSEIASGIIDTTGLPQGRHTLYFRGRDSAGNWGAVSAAFLYLVDPAEVSKLQGTIRDAVTGLPITATITAEQPGGALRFTTQSSGTGIYELLVIPGTYDLVVSAPGYGTERIPSLAAAESQTLTNDFALYPDCVIFSDDVESGDLGWDEQKPWGVTTARSFSPAHAWTESPSGSYGNNWNVSLALRDAFDLSAYSDVTLSFWQVCDTEPDWDFCRVEISTDGGINWEQVAQYDGQGSNWQAISLQLPMFDGASDARFRFRFTSDTNTVNDGWYLDDIQLTGAGAVCIPPVSEAKNSQTKIASSASVYAGDVVTYTLTHQISLTGTHTYAVDLIDTLPETLAVLPETIRAANSSQPGPVSQPNLYNPIDNVLHLKKEGDFTDSHLITVTYQARVKSATPAGTQITGTLQTASQVDGAILPTLTTTAASVAVDTRADLTLAKTRDSQVIFYPFGGLLTLVAANLGPSDAQGITLTATLPAELPYIETTGCQFSAQTGIVTCQVNHLAAGAQTTIGIRTQTVVTGVFSTTASLTAETPDPAAGNNQRSISLEVKIPAQVFWLPIIYKSDAQR